MESSGDLRGEIAAYREALESHSATAGSVSLLTSLRTHQSRFQMASAESLQFAGAILLVETLERPWLWRTAEWAIELPVRLLTGRTLLSVGPFQMRGAKFRRRDAISQAFEKIERALGASGPTVGPVTAVARAWNGAASRQPGSKLGYGAALVAALSLAAVASLASGDVLK